MLLTSPTSVTWYRSLVKSVSCVSIYQTISLLRTFNLHWLAQVIVLSKLRPFISRNLSLLVVRFSFRENYHFFVGSPKLDTLGTGQGSGPGTGLSIFTVLKFQDTYFFASPRNLVFHISPDMHCWDMILANARGIYTASKLFSISHPFIFRSHLFVLDPLPAVQTNVAENSADFLFYLHVYHWMCDNLASTNAEDCSESSYSFVGSYCTNRKEPCRSLTVATSLDQQPGSICVWL